MLQKPRIHSLLGPRFRSSLVAQTVKRLTIMRVDPGSIPGSGRSPGEGNGNPLRYSCLENPMDGGWQTTVHEVTKSQPWPWEFHLKITPFSSTQSQLIWSFNYSPLQHPFTPSCDITMGMTSHLLCYFLMVRTVFPLYRWGDCAGSLNTFCAEEWP